MIKKIDFIKTVDALMASNDLDGALDLQQTLVKGHNYVDVGSDKLSLLKMLYYGFKAELIFEEMLKNAKIVYKVEDKYHDYVIQYGDPFVQMRDSCDYIINNKRCDVKFKERSFFFITDKLFEDWMKSYVNSYKQDEIKRKKLDYFIFFDSNNHVVTYDCNNNKVVDNRTHNIII